MPAKPLPKRGKDYNSWGMLVPPKDKIGNTEGRLKDAPPPPPPMERVPGDPWGTAFLMLGVCMMGIAYIIVLLHI